jgi:hypothetical protein
MAAMKLAVMQPYFFPYLGYWQLIQASDCFVLMDDVQFIRHGWIARNRVMNPMGGWQYAFIRLQKHSHTALIRDVVASEVSGWKTRLLAQLAHYRSATPHYERVREAIVPILEGCEEVSICRINAAIVRGLCGVLGLERDIRIASECGLDYSEVAHTGQWALRMAQQLGADEYLNPIAGAGMFEPAEFAAAGVGLVFLTAEPCVYPRPGEFIPRLSILDVLMFNGIERTRELLHAYALTRA